MNKVTNIALSFSAASPSLTSRSIPAGLMPGT